MNTAAAIEQILDRGKKETTYKLAVLRALVDYVIEHPGREPRNGLHYIPVMEIARRVLAYYWRPALENVRQSKGAGTPVIVRAVRDLAHGDTTVLGIDLQSPRAGLPLVMWMERADTLPTAIVDALRQIRDTLVEQPFQYLPNVGDRRLDVFSLITVGANAPSPDASYEEHRKAAKGTRPFAGATTWLELLDREWASLVLSARAYEEIAELRFWLRDAIILRWAKECEYFAARDATVAVNVFDLELPERDPVLIDKYKRLYADLGVASRCIYTESSLSAAWDLDHVLPMSRFPVNMFWNLVPADPRANNDKRARIPVFTAALRSRYQQLLGVCVASGDDLIAADVRASYRQYYQEPTVPPAETVVRGLVEIMESSHARLEAAGVDVWSPGIALTSEPQAS